MNCPFCGKYNEEGEILCNNCGIKLTARTGQNREEPFNKDQWNSVDYKDGYSDVKKSKLPHIKLPFIDFQKIIFVIIPVLFGIGYLIYTYFPRSDQDSDMYDLMYIVSTLVDTADEENTGETSINPDKTDLSQEEREQLYLSELHGTWVAGDSLYVHPEYHLFSDGTGYIYVKGMYKEKPITWSFNSFPDHASVTMYYTNNLKVEKEFIYRESILYVSGNEYTRLSSEDVVTDDTRDLLLDEESLKWAGTWWARDLDKMTLPIVLLGENGRGQFNYYDGEIVTFTWNYEEDKETHSGYIRVRYVSIDSTDYLIPVRDDMLDMNVYGLYIKESDD